MPSRAELVSLRLGRGAVQLCFSTEELRAVAAAAEEGPLALWLRWKAGAL